MNDFDAYTLDDNAFYQQEYPYNANYASTSSWLPDFPVNIIKQEAPPMTLELPYTPFHSEQDLYATTTNPSPSPWPQEYACPAGWSPYAESTPDLLFTPSNSGHSDSCTNVFDLQFGESLDLDHASSSSYVYPTSLRDQSQTPPTPPGDLSRRRHPCLVPGCLRRFTSQYTLKVHMQAHKPKPRVTFLCTLGCGERFSRQHDRLRHEVAKHNKVCEFSCDACGRFFSSGKTLGNHKCPVGIGGTRWVHS